MKQYWENLRHEGQIVAEHDEKRRRHRQAHAALLAAAKAAVESAVLTDAIARNTTNAVISIESYHQLRAAIAAAETTKE